MFGSLMLEVIIGVLFVFVLVSAISSAIREAIEAWLKTRATLLHEGLRELLHDARSEGLARHFFEHPLIHSLYPGEYELPRFAKYLPTALTRGRRLPSYIPSRNFALALMDMAAHGAVTDETTGHPASEPVSLKSIRRNVLYLDNPAVQRTVLMAIDNAQGDMQKAVANLEAWFDSAMDRVSGSYKRSTHWMLLAIGLVVSVGLNINTLTIADYLYRDKAAREALVARAEAAGADPAFPNRTYEQIRSELASVNLPIGWNAGLPRWPGAAGDPPEHGASTSINWPEAILGWLITALAATMGAPFWFDLLNKVMVIRATVKPREKSPEEGSEDRQLASSGSKDRQVLPQTGGPPGSAGGAGSGSAPGGITPAGATDADAPPAAIPPGMLDGCDVEIAEITRDDELPVAHGGVAE